MARSYDIAEITTSDGGLTEQVRRKINMNFRRIVEISTREKPASDDAGLGQRIESSVEAYVDSLLPSLIRDIEKRVFDEAYPVGCVISTHTSTDPRLSRGRWQAIESGRYVLTAGSGRPVGSTGGSNIIGVGNIPDHVHGIPSGEGPGSQGASLAASSTAGGASTSGVEGHPGGQEPFMPEYVALLFYRRIS